LTLKLQPNPGKLRQIRLRKGKVNQLCLALHSGQQLHLMQQASVLQQASVVGRHKKKGLWRNIE
jgi:hypothetical protein